VLCVHAWQAVHAVHHKRGRVGFLAQQALLLWMRQEAAPYGQLSVFQSAYQQDMCSSSSSMACSMLGI
jgi:hypothetical protein